MKDVGLVSVTLLSLLLAAFAVPAAGWFSSKPLSRSTKLHTATAADLTSEAALRHRRGQPVHWRALVLQH